MALRERNVVGTVVDANGSPISNATIKFKLTTPFAYTITHIVVDREFSTVTDETGAFAVTLWCDEDSLVNVNYSVNFPINAGGLPSDVHIGTFSLAYGDGSTTNLPELMFGGNPAPTPDDLLYTYIETTINEAVAVPRSVFEIPGHFPQCKFPPAYINGAAAGDNDLYTVPAQRKALVQDFIVTNNAGNAINYFPQIKIGSTYYKIGQTISEPNLGFGHNYGMSQSKNSQPIILNAGEKFSVNCSNEGMTIWCNIIEFDAYSPLSRADIHNWIAGQNILLTVPPGRTLHIGTIGFSAANNPAAITQGLNYYNNSGTARSYTGLFILPSGSSPALNNQFAAANTISNGFGFTKFFPGCLAPGDSIVIDMDSGASGQFMWCNYFVV